MNFLSAFFSWLLLPAIIFAMPLTLLNYTLFIFSMDLVSDLVPRSKRTISVSDKLDQLQSFCFFQVVGFILKNIATRRVLCIVVLEYEKANSYVLLNIFLFNARCSYRFMTCLCLSEY